MRPLFCTLSHFGSHPPLTIRQLDCTCVLYTTCRYLITSQTLHWLHFVTWTIPWGASSMRALLNSHTSVYQLLRRRSARDTPGVVSKTPGLWPYYAMGWVGFFGFMHSGEFTFPSLGVFVSLLTNRQLPLSIQQTTVLYTLPDQTCKLVNFFSCMYINVQTHKG